MKSIRTFAIVVFVAILALALTACPPGHGPNGSGRPDNDMPGDNQPPWNGDWGNGHLPPGGQFDLETQLERLRANAQSGGVYVIEISQYETIWGSLPSGRSDVTIILRGPWGWRATVFGGSGSIFTVPSGVTLVLDDNVTLSGGFSGSNNSLVWVDSGGTLVMNEGSRIADNRNSGVHVASGGTFTMHGGEISGNSATQNDVGGGVHVASGGIFNMRGGAISGNSAYGDRSGGGVHVASGGIFRISDGVIHGNDALAGSATLFNAGIAEHGTFNNGLFISQGTLRTTSSTLNIENGVLPVFNWAVVSTGDSHTVALEEGGTLWAWGANWSGQLGGYWWSSRAAPVQVGTATNWATVSAGAGHTVAVTASGELWAWGNGGDGQLGDGSGVSRSIPVRVGTASDWLHVSAGGLHTVAIRTDGTLWAWGSSHGFTPTQIGVAAHWVYVSAGDSHSVAITTSGELWAWGSNSQGQIGDGTTSARWAPVRIGTESGWATASAGFSHTVAVTTNGELWAWGSQWNGQLGDGETTGNQSIPIRIGADTNWAQVSASNSHTVAVRTDGTVWAWGANSYGQLGDGTDIDRATPVQTGMLTSSWASVSAGGSHTSATRWDGTLWAWGANSSGQIGDGTTTHRVNMVQVLP